MRELRAKNQIHLPFVESVLRVKYFFFILYYFMGIINIKYQLKRQFKFSSSTKQNKFLTLHQLRIFLLPVYYTQYRFNLRHNWHLILKILSDFFFFSFSSSWGTSLNLAQTENIKGKRSLTVCLIWLLVRDGQKN